MTDPLDDFLRAYDAWADSPELCAGPLFDRMLEARGALDAAMSEAGLKSLLLAEPGGEPEAEQERGGIEDWARN